MSVAPLLILILCYTCLTSGCLYLQLTCSLSGFPPPLPLDPSPGALTAAIIECEWSGIEDVHSGIEGYLITIADTSKSDQILYQTSLPGTVTLYVELLVKYSALD